MRRIIMNIVWWTWGETWASCLKPEDHHEMMSERNIQGSTKKMMRWGRIYSRSYKLWPDITFYEKKMSNYYCSMRGERDGRGKEHQDDDDGSSSPHHWSRWLMPHIPVTICFLFLISSSAFPAFIKMILHLLFQIWWDERSLSECRN